METTPVPTTEVACSEPRTFNEMMLYKIDRTMAIAGIIILGLGAIYVSELSTTASQVVTLCIGGLATYIGAKAK